MTKAKLLRLISGDEDSTVEFKRDDIENYKLAKELVAFLNLEGGTVLLGVEKDGSISGVTRDRIQEWVGNLCRDKIEPPITPLLSWARDAAPGRDHAERGAPGCADGRRQLRGAAPRRPASEAARRG